MKRYFFSISIIKKNENNEVEDIEFMNCELETDKISSLDDIHHLEDEIRDDLVRDGYIEKEDDRWMYNITVISFQRFD